MSNTVSLFRRVETLRREDGKYEYQTKRGVTLVLTAEQLVKRLLWLIPPKSLHLTNFHGVFSSHSAARAALLPAATPPDADPQLRLPLPLPTTSPAQPRPPCLPTRAPALPTPAFPTCPTTRFALRSSSPSPARRQWEVEPHQVRD